MKIKKNLTDAEMLKGYKEQESFETAILKKEKVEKPDVNKKIEQGMLLSLPAEIIEKLDQEVFKVRLALKKQGISEVKWQITTKETEIIIKPVVKKK